MKHLRSFSAVALVRIIFGLCLLAFPTRAASPWTTLFPNDGPPSGWKTRSWNDVSHPAPPNAAWTITNGVLKGSVPRGTWLVSDSEFANFILEFEFRLGERGRGGVGLRIPAVGDPAFEALVIPMVDPRYHGTHHIGKPWESNGAILKAVAPSADAYKPLEWNRYVIECRGSGITVTLNRKKVIDIDLTKQAVPLDRGKPLADRPRRGRIGFQEISRGQAQLEIRNARIRALD